MKYQSRTNPEKIEYSWIERNWRRVLLLSIIFLGVNSMAIFKIYIAWNSWPYVFLIFFTEIAAGVAVFAQALLRRVSEEKADKALKLSYWARGIMAVIGVALFLEYNTIVPELPYVKVTGGMTWTAFLTYELGNGLMILMEWMFSHLLADDDFDARKVLTTMTEKLEEYETRSMGLEKLLDDATNELDLVRQILQGKDVPVENHEPPLVGLTRELKYQVEERQANMENFETDLEVFGKILQGKKVSLEKVSKEHIDLAKQLEESSKYKLVVEGMLGKVFTLRKNVQGFYCEECLELTEKSLKAPVICKHCNHVHAS